MNRMQRMEIEAAMRRLRFKRKLADDAFGSNMRWLCWSMAATVVGLVGAFVVHPVIFLFVGIWPLPIGVTHLWLAVDNARKFRHLGDRLEDEQIKLLLDRAPSADR